MTLDWILAGVVFTLLLLAWVFHRISQWHLQEAGYWRYMGILVNVASSEALLDMRRTLDWSQMHPTSWPEKVRGWVAPHERRKRCRA